MEDNASSLVLLRTLALPSGISFKSALRKGQSTKSELAERKMTSYAFAAARVSLTITILLALRGASGLNFVAALELIDGEILWRS